MLRVVVGKKQMRPGCREERERLMQRGDVCVGGKRGTLFCIEEVFIKNSEWKKKQKKKNNGSQGAAVLCSPVKVAPSFVLSSQRISNLSFLQWHFDVEAVRCSRVLSCPPPQSGGPVLASLLAATSSWRARTAGSLCLRYEEASKCFSRLNSLHLLSALLKITALVVVTSAVGWITATLNEVWCDSDACSSLHTVTQTDFQCVPDPINLWFISMNV